MTRLFHPDKYYDIIVVGGGIHGCALAYEASAQGLKVALFEQHDFCSNTSANTLKFIHGGIRYLQNFNFKRVAQSLREQALLMRIAPHLVQPITCAMPTTKKPTRGVLAMRCGFLAYKLIAGVTGNGAITSNNKVISKNKLNEKPEWLNHDDYTGVALWNDAQVSHAERLGLEFVLAAKRMGADVYNYARVVDVGSTQNKFRSVSVIDELTNTPHEMKGQIMVAPVGPWRSKLMDILNLPQTKAIGHVKAVNIIVKQPYSEWALGLTNRKDKRLFFAAPWQQHTLLGTWYFNREPVENAAITQEETQAILDDVHAAFTGINTTQEDIVFAHIGWLPSNPNEASAHDSLHDKDLIQQASETGGPENIWLVSGVKFTTARAVAEQIAARLKSKFADQRKRIPRTTPLDGGILGDVEAFANRLVNRYKTMLPEKTVRRLIGAYGASVDTVMSYANADATLMQPIPGTENSLQAEILHTVKNELAHTAQDVLVRRSGLYGATKPPAQSIKFCDHMIAAIQTNG